MDYGTMAARRWVEVFEATSPEHAFADIWMLRDLDAEIYERACGVKFLAQSAWAPEDLVLEELMYEVYGSVKSVLRCPGCRSNPGDCCCGCLCVCHAEVGSR